MESDSESKALVPAESGTVKSVAGRGGMVVPRVIADAGEQAARRLNSRLQSMAFSDQIALLRGA
jgi:hypothetical protein